MMGTTMAGKLIWPGTGLLLTILVLWHAGRAGWTPPRPPAAAGGDPDGQAPGGRAPRRDHTVAEGRLVAYPGAEVVVSAEVMGLILDLPVAEKSVVRKGDLIASLKSDELRAARAEARAKVAEAEADIRHAEREVVRAERLEARRAGTMSELDTYQKNLATARARREAASASCDRLDALIDKTRIMAPIAGTVIARHAHPGEVVNAGTRLVTVADLARVRVEAEVDEFDVGRVALGSEVLVTAEGYPGAFWRGHVEEIPDAVIGRGIRPEDPGRPVDLRVLLVKIALDEPTPLKLGQRVEVEIAHDPPRQR
jgi:multidrug efflux pump subunit AcrA (membrane-fusion protein)